MSLLIKALQKAEEAKNSDGKVGASASDSSLELSPAEVAAEHGPIDNDRIAQQPYSSGQQNEHSSQQAAAGMFKAKNVQPSSMDSNKTLLIAGAGLLGLLLLGAGFYFYLNGLQQPELIMPKPPAGMVQPSAPVETTASKNDATNLVPPPADQVSPATVVANPPEMFDKPPANIKEESVSDSAQAATPRRSRPKSPQLVFGEPVATSEDTSVKVTRNNPTPGINPGLLSAYQAFNTGDDATAQRFYRQVLQGDVRNVDALLGMAAIASRQGRNEDAAGWYGKVLELEPRNSVAQAAMINMLGQSDPVASESRLKNLLAQQPESAPLYAALGNVYAEQEQWSSAQQAYFQAHRFDANNAEYAFNLAVSLDQLGKSALALQYYKRALELVAKSSAGSINQEQLKSRIRKLQEMAG